MWRPKQVSRPNSDSLALILITSGNAKITNYKAKHYKGRRKGGEARERLTLYNSLKGEH
jgi:hypothetical protein